jgi:uncharacterized membrane protein YkvI
VIRWIQTYLTPAAVFVSVVIGGGYGTGREVVEYFSLYGMKGGLLGMGMATIVFAVVLACTYEFARVFGVYEYRNFFRQLIGHFWFLFELLYVLAFVLIMGVISSAAGKIVEQELGLPGSLGLIAMLVLVSSLVMFGRGAVEKVLTLWCVLMYGVFAVYLVKMWGAGGSDPWVLVAASTVDREWWVGGLLYPMYNVAIAPVLLFSARAIRTRRQAIGAGAFTAVFAMVPALLFHLSYTVGYPDVIEQPIPNYWMIDRFGSPLLMAFFLVALFGTLVQTGAGLVHGLIERVEAMLGGVGGHGLNRFARAAIAVSALIVSGLVGLIGIIELIGKGYSATAFGFALVYVLPICTWGVIRIARAGAAAGISPEPVTRAVQVAPPD